MKIVPHVILVGRALVPMILAVVGFQLLIHVKGLPTKALVPNDIDNVGNSDTNVLVIFIGMSLITMVY